MTKEEKAAALRKKFEANLAKLNASVKNNQANDAKKRATQSRAAAKRAEAMVKKVANLTMKNRRAAAHAAANLKLAMQHHSW